MLHLFGYHIYVNKIRLLNNNKKKIYKKVRNWNKLYDENSLDLFKASQSLMSWMGHAKLGNNFEYIKKIRKKCKWLYIDENEENYLEKFITYKK